MAAELALFQVLPAVVNELNAAVAEAFTLADITSKDSADAARACNARLSKSVKALAENRLTFTREVDALKQRAMAYEKLLAKEAVEAGSAIDAALLEYLSTLERERAAREAVARAAEQLLAEEEARNGVNPAVGHVTAPIVALVLEPEAAAIPTRDIPRVVVMNKALIPLNFLDVSDTRILAAHKAGIPVPGTKIEFDRILVRR